MEDVDSDFAEFFKLHDSQSQMMQMQPRRSPSKKMKKTTKEAIKQAKQKFHQDRWEAIEKGKNTDCVFLLADDNQSAPKKFHAVKWLVITASETFDRMFNGALAPVDNVVQIKDVKPKIFKCLLQYIHLSEIYDEIDCQEAVDLAQAADMYLMEPLKKHCIALIESSMTVEKVWGLLSQLLQVNLPDLAAACFQLLSTDTLECLEHETFLSASEESVITLLKLDNLNVASEMLLIKYCKKWAEANSAGTEPREVMRRLIPHLRLLTLSSAEAAELTEFVTCKEKLALMTFLALDRSNAKRAKVDLPPTICPLSTARIQLYKDVVLDLYPCSGPAFSQDIEAMSSSLKIRTSLRTIENVIKITAKVDIHITNWEGFCKIEDVPKVRFNDKTGSYEDAPKYSKYSGQVISRMKDGFLIDSTYCSKKKSVSFKYNCTWSVKSKNPYAIARGETKEIILSMSDNDGGRCAIFRKIEEEEANAHMKEYLATNEAGKHIEQVTISSYCNSNVSPIFLKSFSYAVKN